MSKTEFLECAPNEPKPTLGGPPVKSRRLPTAMLEHEIHHRSQLAMYLVLMGIQPPNIYALE